MNEFETQVLINQYAIMRALHYTPRNEDIDEKLRENGIKTNDLLNPKDQETTEKYAEEAKKLFPEYEFPKLKFVKSEVRSKFGSRQ